MQARSPIGIFDSGSGGLTVVKQLHKILPCEDIIYVGDLRRMPYGPRNPREIIKFMYQFLRFFTQQKVKMAVFACNTITSWGYEEALSKVNYPLVPMDTAVTQAAASCGHKAIGVIATEATVRKKFHAAMAAKLDKNIKLYAKACPDFVTLIEKGHIEDDALAQAVATYLADFKEKDIGALILGCTHYPIIKSTLSKYFGSAVKLIDPALATAQNAAKILKERNLLNGNTQRIGNLQFFFSAQPKHAAEMVQMVMGIKNPLIKNIDLAEFD